LPERADQIVAAGRVVSLGYTLCDDDGSLLDSSSQSGPLVYIHGLQGILPALARGLEGRRVGERFSVVIPPAEAYGERVPDQELVIPLSSFPDDAEVEEGLPLASQEPNGRFRALWVVRVDGDSVVLANNHPFAGICLNFAIEVIEIRPASAREQRQGFPGSGGDQATGFSAIARSPQPS